METEEECFEKREEEGSRDGSCADADADNDENKDDDDNADSGKEDVRGSTPESHGFAFAAAVP